jgi:hypothetical protein
LRAWKWFLDSSVEKAVNKVSDRTALKIHIVCIFVKMINRKPFLGQGYQLFVVIAFQSPRDFIASLGGYACQNYFSCGPLPLQEFEEFAKRA